MLWQGVKWRILKNFNVQNEECHNYVALPKTNPVFVGCGT
jgi:hypothetical protein